MGLWDRLVGEFIDVIEWTNRDHNLMVYRFERFGNAIKSGAILTVREGQTAVFVSEGSLADVFGPGTYELTTANLPLLSTLQAWQHGFNNPFKAEVYFFDTTRFSDLKWGTKNPIMLRDAEFGPVRLRAFGTYELRIFDPALFLREVVGTDGDFMPEEITGQLRNMIISKFSTAIAKSRIPVLDLAASYEKLSDYITEAISQDFADYGLELTRLLVENISLPPAVEEALDRRTSMGVIGNLDAYTKFQAAESLRLSAQNSGGGMGAGMGAGMGMGLGAGMGAAMAQVFTPANQSTGPWGSSQAAGQVAARTQTVPAAPPPLPSAPTYFLALDGKQTGPFDMAQLKNLRAEGRLEAQTLAWCQGMPTWSAAGELEVLADLFTDPAAPPPLPPIPPAIS